MTLSTINLSKTGSASISFAANRFFCRYSFNGGGRQWTERFYCVLWSKVRDTWPWSVEASMLNHVQGTHCCLSAAME